MDLKVEDAPERSRYEVSADGKVVGFAAYHQLDDGVMALPHVEVDPSVEGKGVASALMRESLDDIRRRGLEVMPVCPFAVAFVERNPDYRDLVHTG